jgi:hypothetical protein
MSAVTPFVGMTDLNPLAITAMTKANPCVITVTGNASVALGRSVFITDASLGVGTGTLNGTWTVTGVSGQDITLSLDSSAFGDYLSSGLARPIFNVTNVSGQDVTIDVDSTGFGTYVSGGQAVFKGAASLRTALRAATKSAPSALYLQNLNFQNCLLAGGVCPSIFQLGGLPAPQNNAWSVLETIYQTPDPPAWDAIKLFGARKRRLMLKT